MLLNRTGSGWQVPSVDRRVADFEPTVRAKGEAQTKSDADLRNVNEHCSLAKEPYPL